MSWLFLSPSVYLEWVMLLNHENRVCSESQWYWYTMTLYVSPPSVAFTLLYNWRHLTASHENILPYKIVFKYIIKGMFPYLSFTCMPSIDYRIKTTEKNLYDLKFNNRKNTSAYVNVRLSAWLLYPLHKCAIIRPILSIQLDKCDSDNTECIMWEFVKGFFHYFHFDNCFTLFLLMVKHMVINHRCWLVSY